MPSRRRLPVHFLVEDDGDTPGGLARAIGQGLKTLITGLRSDAPEAVDLSLSVIRYGRGAEHLLPPTDLSLVDESCLDDGRQHQLREGLLLLEASREAVAPDGEPGYKPLVFLINSRPPTDAWGEVADRIKESKGRIVIACTLGPDARPSGLYRLTDIVLSHPESTPAAAQSFLGWMADSIQAVGRNLGPPGSESPVNLPDLPPPIRVAAREVVARRLPVYFVIDCNLGMAGEPIEAVRQGLKALIAELKGDARAIETAYLSLITFDSEARLVLPLTDVSEVQIPAIEAGVDEGRALGKALRLLDRRVQVDVRPASATDKGDWLPLIFLLTDGSPTDSWEDAADRIKRKKIGSFNACGAGPGADTAGLKRITENVVHLSDLQPEALKAYFKWISGSIKATSEKTIKIVPERDKDPEADGEGGLTPSSAEPAQPLRPRCLPIYVVLDCAEGSPGGSIEAARQSLRSVMDELRSDPMLVEIGSVSVITFGESTGQVYPLTDLSAYESPALQAVPGPGRDLAGALAFLERLMGDEVRPSTATDRGDWWPLIILLLNGPVTGDWEPSAERIKKRYSPVIACAAGAGEVPPGLRRITDLLVEHQDLRPRTIKEFSEWFVANTVRRITVDKWSSPYEELPST